MSKTYFNPPELFPSVQYGFSQIVSSQGGRTIYISGQVAWNEKQEIVGSGDFRAQVWQSLRNLETALKVAGGKLQDVVSLRIYIVEGYLGESKPVSEGLRAFFPGDTPPTSTWIGVRGLANEDFLIEIEAIAVVE